MIALTVALALQLTDVCPLVQQLRAAGYNDVEIAEIARSQKVPEWVIRYARKKCVVT